MTSPDKTNTFKTGLRQDRIATLTVGEDPGERGITHGKTFKAQVAANIETYLKRFEASGMKRPDAYAESKRWGAAMQRQNPEYAEEMSGLARGADQHAAAGHHVHHRSRARLRPRERRRSRAASIRARPLSSTT